MTLKKSKENVDHAIYLAYQKLIQFLISGGDHASCDIPIEFNKHSAKLSLLIPVIKLKPGRFFIGTKPCQIVMVGTTAQVRIGGGFAPFLEYMAKNAASEGRNFRREM